MSRIVPWLGVAALVLFPAVYFVIRWCDVSFREAAIADWFGTIAGVIVGVPVGLALARFQQRAAVEADRRKEVEIRDEKIRSIKHPLYSELEYNSKCVEQLAVALSKSPHARRDLWDWVKQIADSVEFEAYGRFDAILLPEERGHYGGLLLAYENLRRLVNRVRESALEFVFLTGYSANEEEADYRLTEIKQKVNIVLSEITRALEELRSGR